MNQYVWYACYGSNLCRERFLLYILGGRLEHFDRVYRGCSNKSLPIKDSAITIPYELYFAKESETWENKSIAFIKSKRDKTKKTLSRIYLVTKEQFIEINLQEQQNGKDSFYDTSNINLQLAKEKGFSFVGNENDYQWYGRIIYIGEKEDFPVFSFTAKWRDEDIICSKPGDKYLKKMIKGIKEGFGLNDGQILNYLIEKCGIKNNLSRKHLQNLINEAK